MNPRATRLKTALTLTALAAITAGASLTAGGSAVAQAELAPLTFTAQQASAGRSTFATSCAPCHGANLQGGGGPALVGGAFNRYVTRPVSSLLEFISANMPADNPGTLSAQQYLTLIAFIAQSNGFTAGATALPGDVEALAQMGFRQ